MESLRFLEVSGVFKGFELESKVSMELKSFF